MDLGAAFLLLSIGLLGIVTIIFISIIELGVRIDILKTRVNILETRASNTEKLTMLIAEQKIEKES